MDGIVKSEDQFDLSLGHHYAFQLCPHYREWNESIIAREEFLSIKNLQCTADETFVPSTPIPRVLTGRNAFPPLTAPVHKPLSKLALEVREIVKFNGEEIAVPKSDGWGTVV